jgi:small-conductance mechanosensitive channel
MAVAATNQTESAVPLLHVSVGTLPDWLSPENTFGALIWGAIFALFAYILGRAVRIGVRRILERDKRGLIDHTTVSFLAQLAQSGIYVFAFISYAHLVPVLHHLGTAWLTSVGVASVVFGLAAQNTLGNLIAGISLLLYQPFKLGDRIQVVAPTGLETGVVESLTLGYTVLQTADRRRVVVPNSVMASQTTVNLCLVEERTSCTITVGIGYRSDIDKARAILMELARQHAHVLDVSACRVADLANSSVQLALSLTCENADAVGPVKADLLESAKKRFEKEGIEIPFPYTNVIVQETRQDADRAGGSLPPAAR